MPANQGCSLGLERPCLEAVARRILERLGLVSVSRVWKNRTSRSLLSLEDITSRSRSRDISLVISMQCIRLADYQEENNGSDPQETCCQVTDGSGPAVRYSQGPL